MRTRAGRNNIVILTLVVLMLVSQSGCFYVETGKWFGEPVPKSTRQSMRFSMQNQQTNIHGILADSTHIVFTFLPVVSFLLIHTNPYHLRLDINHQGDQEIEVTSVTVETLEGRVLFHTDQPVDFSGESKKFQPVFSENQAFEGPGARWSSKNGWPNSRPIQMPWFCKKVRLSVKVQPKDHSQPGWEISKILTRYQASVFFVATDSLFLSTGGFPANGWAGKKKRDNDK